jgi:two-component system, LytTR family, response regulator
LKSFQRNAQPTAVSELQTIDVPLRVLVSEPDITSRRLICALLQSDAETTVTCVEDSQLLSAVHETAPHIVVVDVHSPSIRRALNWEALGIQEAPATIVTGFDLSAVSTFASNAVDFLVKPFDVERLESALDLATAAIGPTRSAETPADTLRHAEHTGEQRRFLHRLAVEADERIVLLRTEDIEWLQASGNHIRIHLGQMVYLLRQSLKNLQVLLDPSRFLRVHRNAIVNLDHVKEFYLPAEGNMFVRLKNGLSLPLRKANRALLRKTLKRPFIA